MKQRTLLQPDENQLPASLLQNASSFVTLYSEAREPHRLRGCIGSTHAAFPLAHDVAQNTVAAAHDPRFAPVLARELPHLRIQISVLHPARRLAYGDYQDLLARLRPGVDGVIIAWREQKALLLPQVWERLPSCHAFMQALCRKAHIPWRVLCSSPPEVEVVTFAATTFSEYEWPATREDAPDGAQSGGLSMPPDA